MFRACGPNAKDERLAVSNSIYRAFCRVFCPTSLLRMGGADEFLLDGDFGLSVGGGHFPARVIQRVTGSPYPQRLGGV